MRNRGGGSFGASLNLVDLLSAQSSEKSREKVAVEECVLVSEEEFECQRACPIGREWFQSKEFARNKEYLSNSTLVSSRGH